APRRWIITGASRGLGRAVAEIAVQHGDKVALLARGDETDRAAAALGGGAIALKADVSKPESIAAACDAAAQKWGGIDIVINNAGLHRGGLADKLDLADWDAVIAANLSGPFHTIRAALPHMSDGGSIVNIGAVVGFRGFAGDSPYGASKAGLSGLTQVLAVELARRGIRVNLVIPGFVSTAMTAGVAEKAREKLVARIPLRREGRVEEIARVVWWVAGSTYMTGSTVATDGGLMCGL
ncbi:MAG: SDR family oxidoreductase, partial [Rhodospirillaceae bacterium]|nr:SDR family oxidoreductase [Rhodospirillaceae bacterium]